MPQMREKTKQITESHFLQTDLNEQTDLSHFVYLSIFELLEYKGHGAIIWGSMCSPSESSFLGYGISLCKSRATTLVFGIRALRLFDSLLKRLPGY